MRSFSKLTIVTLIASCLVSCGRRHEAELKGQPAERPLIVGLGGYNTCMTGTQHGSWEAPLGMTLHLRTENLRRTLQANYGIEVDVILSCFTRFTELRFVESTDNYAKLNTNQQINDFIRLLHQKIDKHSKVYIMSHSYGGWLGMRTVAEYQGSRTHIKSLYSVDPISRPHCQIENPFAWGGCRLSPPDIDDKARQLIGESTGRWFNFWQNQTFYLHSAEISQADNNMRLAREHTDINDADEVWKFQLEDIVATF